MADEENIMQETIVDGNMNGNILIAPDVVATVAALAAADVKGIANMGGGRAEGFVEMLGRKSTTKGVKVEIVENAATIDLFAVVEYGVYIGEVAREVQRKVKEAVETMTGLKCAAVNVNIQGVTFPQKEE